MLAASPTASRPLSCVPGSSGVGRHDPPPRRPGVKVRDGKFAWIGGGTSPHVDHPRGQHRRGDGVSRRTRPPRPGLLRHPTAIPSCSGIPVGCCDPGYRGTHSQHPAGVARRSRASPRSLAPPAAPRRTALTRFAVWLLGARACTIDDSKARDKLGYTPVRRPAVEASLARAAHAASTRLRRAEAPLARATSPPGLAPCRARRLDAHDHELRDPSPARPRTPRCGRCSAAAPAARRGSRSRSGRAR